MWSKDCFPWFCWLSGSIPEYLLGVIEALAHRLVNPSWASRNCPVICLLPKLVIFRPWRGPVFWLLIKINYWQRSRFQDAECLVHGGCMLGVGVVVHGRRACSHSPLTHTHAHGHEHQNSGLSWCNQMTYFLLTGRGTGEGSWPFVEFMILMRYILGSIFGSLPFFFCPRSNSNLP